MSFRASHLSAWQAVASLAVVLTSLEIAYHARWVAPDAVQMQFAALWLMLFALALHSQKHVFGWLRVAAVAAGFSCGTKYQGGILLLPVLIYAVIRLRQENSDRGKWGLV